MTIPEACRLVMEAATIGRGNTIFVFDMGECVKIAELARRMIALAGFRVDQDIRIVYTGLRPGEKLYEEVLSNTENTLPTAHEKIRIAKVREYDYEEACRDVEELERLARERQEKDPIDWRSIQNQVSNENALNEKLRDDRGTNAAALNDAAAAAEERMRANREAYEQGLAEERAIRQRRGAGEDSEHQDRKVKGRVTVSFSLTDPVRTRRYLEVPAYQCEGGGEVVVGITVNPSGEVVAAKVASGGDDCMREAALEAARNSLFNIDDSAPARQSGTITYLFIPQ